jgi:hypothetical protein
LLVVLAGCNEPARLTIGAGDDSYEAVRAFADLTEGLDVVRGSGQITLTIDRDCGDCYSVDVDANGARVRGGSVLGVQYGLADLLERIGYRFYHPYKSRVPPSLSLPPPGAGEVQTPQMALRGLHLHTLHPIEGYFDFWEPSAENLAGAKRVIDWLVKSRGNFIQWPALDDIVADPTAWQAHTRAILDYAHGRGVTVGLGVQLFDSGNKQNAYDLLQDDNPGDTAARARQRFLPIVGELPFDKVQLSFGEFFAAEPDLFVREVNTAYDALQAVRPGIEMTTLIHVGNTPELRVQYMGMDMLYYFLALYANPAIVPWIHTVMFYNLFEDAGGAYHHEEFDEHRRLLQDRIMRGERAAYFPETGYWVTFDNPIPQYYPLYFLSRWTDLSQLLGLREHTVFSTGWEWGYWQNDYLALRMSFATPADWRTSVAEMFAPYGERGARLAATVVNLATLQHEMLLVKRLAPYLQGMDFLIEAGYAGGIVSQPRRPLFTEFATQPDRQDVLARLADYAARLGQLSVEPHDEPFFDEVRDGIEIDRLRAQQVTALFQAVVVHAAGGDTGPLLATADAALADAREVVARRHARLHDPRPARNLVEADNATLYHYGYLFYADTLCYWERDLLQVRELISGTPQNFPGCVLGF